MSKSTVLPDWLGAPPVIPESSISETLEFDIVVCGGGNAGVSVARAAAAEEASVAVLELQAEENYMFLGEQIGHFNSKWLKEHGFEPADLNEVVAEFQLRSANYSNPELIRQYVYNSGEMFDSLMALVPEDHPMHETMNVHISGDPEQKYPIVRSGYKTWAGTVQYRKGILSEPRVGVASYSSMTELEEIAMEDAKAHGAKWFFENDCQVLVKDGDRVVGCIAKNGEGKYVKYLAKKGVALCCGDFGRNNDMVVALLDEVREMAELRGQDLKTLVGFGHDENRKPLGQNGKGHKLGCWAGGHIEPGPRACMISAHPGAGFGFTTMMTLNCKGERFMNEALYNAQTNYIFRQPLGMIVALYDSKLFDYLRLSSIEHGQPDFGVPEYQRQAKEDIDMLVAGNDKYPIRSCSITERMPSGEFYAADTLEELGKKLGYEGEALDNFLASVERYNELCRQGVDNDFGKDKILLWPIDKAPFIANKSDNLMVNIGLVTITGLQVDNNQQVMGEDCITPIPGLYTCGNNCGGRYAMNYACPVAGNSIGMAMTLGRVLGRHMAKL